MPTRIEIGANAAQAMPLDQIGLLDAFIEKMEIETLSKADKRYINKVEKANYESPEYTDQKFLFLKGLAYLNDDKQSDARAIDYFEQAAAQGHVKAQYNLGHMYWHGRGTGSKEVQNAQAIDYFDQAAAQGHVKAQYNLGQIYGYGRGTGSKKFQNARAIDYFEQAAAQGHVKAQHNLGVMYWHGRGTGSIKDQDARARDYFEQAAEQEDVKAQYNLGHMYWYGRGTGSKKVQDAGARVYFEQAAAQGHVKAQYNLGVMYLHGRGTGSKKVQNARAIEFFERAAAQGHLKAQYNLGAIYWHGRGTGSKKVQDARAIDYFDLAAAQEHVKAQYRLGHMYWHGRGTGSTKVQNARALEYFERAIEGGYPDLEELVSRLKIALGRADEVKLKDRIETPNPERDTASPRTLKKSINETVTTTPEFAETSAKSKPNRTATRFDIRMSNQLFREIHAAARLAGVDGTVWMQSTLVDYLKNYSDQIPPPFRTQKADTPSCVSVSPEIAERIEEAVAQSGLNRSAWLKSVFHFTLKQSVRLPQAQYDPE